MSLTLDRDHQLPTTLTFIGCGTLGTAILCGVLTDLAENGPTKAIQSTKFVGSETTRPLSQNHLPSIPNRFIACVRTPRSAERLKAELAKYQKSFPISILYGENARAVEAADLVLLGCQPQDLESCIGSPAVIKALRGKLLVSILAGVTIPQIEAILSPGGYGTLAPKANGTVSLPNGPQPSPSSSIVVRAMPNTASFVRASATVITSTLSATSSELRLVDWLFNCIGTVTHIAPAQFDTCTALCGSTPAFFALFLESLVDGAVALGLKRFEAQQMAAETMKGAAMLILGGEPPEKVREKISTPGGSTIRGLLNLERAAMRGIVADALMECKLAAGKLGEK